LCVSRGTNDHCAELLHGIGKRIVYVLSTYGSKANYGNNHEINCFEILTYVGKYVGMLLVRRRLQELFQQNSA
jgi:hypothetical protein